MKKGFGVFRKTVDHSKEKMGKGRKEVLGTEKRKELEKL
jgi:hypothetical protein